MEDEYIQKRKVALLPGSIVNYRLGTGRGLGGIERKARCLLKVKLTMK